MENQKLTLRDLINSAELVELNIEELMEVQGGAEMDAPSCDGVSMCSGAPAVVYCTGSGGI